MDGTLTPASKKHVVPCPKCKQGWPIVQAQWRRSQGKPKDWRGYGMAE